jgi:hypothetical protein
MSGWAAEFDAGADADLLLGCVAGFAAAEIERRQVSQVPWNTVPVRTRRLRSPQTGVGSPDVVSPAAKRACQVNPYHLLTPPADEFDEEVGESVQVKSPPRVTRQSARLQAEADKLVADMLVWDQVSEAVRRSPEVSVSEECDVVGEERSRSEAGEEALLTMRERILPLTGRR